MKITIVISNELWEEVSAEAERATEGNVSGLESFRFMLEEYAADHGFPPEAITVEDA